jgi:hypothetical protein
VDYDNDEEYQDDPNGSEDESDDEENYDRMDPNEIADILDDQVQHNDNQANPEEINNQDSKDEASENNDNKNNDNDDDDDEEAAPDPEQDDEEQSHEAPTMTTRSGREVRVPARFRRAINMNVQANRHVEYGFETAKVIARHICAFNEMQQNVTHRLHAFVQQFSLKAGLKKFGQRGHDAAYKKMKQLHQRAVFVPVDINSLTEKEKSMAMESLIFLTEKRDGTIKGRTCANGSVQRNYMTKEEATSPTVMTESILITATLEAAENRDIMTADIPNAFVQTDIPYNENDEKIVMKMRGPLVDMLVDLDLDTYKDYVVYEGHKNNKVLYLQVNKAIYGMLQSSLLFYKKFKKDLESIGFKINL